MPRYIVQRTFPDGLLALEDSGARTCRAFVEQNSLAGVTWVTSYVSHDQTRTFCVYDAPSPHAIVSAASANRLPVDEIVEVRAHDTCFYHDRADACAVALGQTAWPTLDNWKGKRT